MSPDTFQTGNGVPGSSDEMGGALTGVDRASTDAKTLPKTAQASSDADRNRPSGQDRTMLAGRLLFGTHSAWRKFQIKIEVSDMPVMSCLPSGVNAKASDV